MLPYTILRGYAKKIYGKIVWGTFTQDPKYAHKPYYYPIIAYITPVGWCEYTTPSGRIHTSVFNSVFN